MFASDVRCPPNLGTRGTDTFPVHPREPTVTDLASTARQATKPTENAAPVKGRKRGLLALAFGSVVDGFEGGLMNTLFPVIRDSLNLQTSALGIMTAISRIARMFAGPGWAVLADRFGRKKILFIATGLWGLWTVAAGFAQNFTQLMILFGIGVIGTVAAEPIVNGLITDMYRAEERGRAFGALRTVSTACSLLGTPLIAQFAGSPDGWRYGMFFMGGISVVSGILILVFVSEPRAASRGAVTASDAGAPKVLAFNLRDAVGLLKTRSILFMVVQIVLTTNTVLLAFFVTFFVDERGWSTPAAATLMAVFMGGGVLGSLLGGIVGDWFEKRMGPRGRVFLMQGYLVSYAAATLALFQLDWGRGPLIFAIAFLSGMIGFVGHVGAVLPVVGSVVPKAVISTAYALVFSFVQGGMATLLSLAFGFLADEHGLQTLVFWLVSVPYAANAVFWTLMHRIYPKDVSAVKAREALGPTGPSGTETADADR